MQLESIMNLLQRSEQSRDIQQKTTFLLEALKQYFSLSYDPLLITTTGVVATAPGVSSTTDIIERQMAFNTVDMIGFINLGGEIVQWNMTATANMTLTGVTVTLADEQNAGNNVLIAGTKFEAGMTVSLAAAGVVFSNVATIYNSPTQLRVNFDAAGDISADTTVTATVTKGVYSTTITFALDTDLEVASANVSYVGKSAAETIILTMNENFAVIDDVIVSDPAINVVSATRVAPNLITVVLDTSAVTAEGAFTITVGADGEIAPAFSSYVRWALVMTNMTPETFGVSLVDIPYSIDVNREPVAGFTIYVNNAEFTSITGVYGAGKITGLISTAAAEFSNIRVVVAEPTDGFGGRFPEIQTPSVIIQTTETTPVAKGASVSVHLVLQGNGLSSATVNDFSDWTFTIEENADVTFNMAVLNSRTAIECSVNTSAAVADLTFKIKAINTAGNVLFITDAITITP